MDATLPGPRWLYVTLGGLIAAAAVAVTGGLINAQSPTPPPADSTPAASSTDQSFDDILAEELGIGVDELREAQSNASDRYFDQLVDSGDLTAKEAASLKAASPGEIAAGALDVSEFDLLYDFAIAQVASVLDMEPAELEQDLRDGKSFSDIADEQGVSEDEIRDEVQTVVTGLIDLAVQAGFIDEEDGDSLKENVGEILDITFDTADGEDDSPAPTVTSP